MCAEDPAIKNFRILKKSTLQGHIVFIICINDIVQNILDIPTCVAVTYLNMGLLLLQNALSHLDRCGHFVVSSNFNKKCDKKLK